VSDCESWVDETKCRQRCSQILPNSHDEDTGIEECAVADTGNKLFELLSVTDLGKNATLSP
jgi:hypothetical protein